jgi:hypothetical protein
LALKAIKECRVRREAKGHRASLAILAHKEPKAFKGLKVFREPKAIKAFKAFKV